MLYVGLARPKERVMYIYDKHDFSVRSCVYDLVSKIEVPESDERPTFVEIGCGFHARFSGDILYALFQAALRGLNPASVEFHLVDPTLYGYYSQIAALALHEAFGNIDFRTHATMWTSELTKDFLTRADKTTFCAAFALETTTLIDDDGFHALFKDLTSVLRPGGYFMDVSEVDDMATSHVYNKLRIFQRSEGHREALAKEHGFTLVARCNAAAHACSVPDNQQMVGMLFRRA